MDRTKQYILGEKFVWKDNAGDADKMKTLTEHCIKLFNVV